MTVRKRLKILGERLEETLNDDMMLSFVGLILIIGTVMYILIPLTEFIVPIIFSVGDIYYMAVGELAYLEQFEISNWLDELVLRYSIYEVIIGCAAILVSLSAVIILSVLKIISWLLIFTAPIEQIDMENSVQMEMNEMKYQIQQVIEEVEALILKIETELDDARVILNKLYAIDDEL